MSRKGKPLVDSKTVQGFEYASNSCAYRFTTGQELIAAANLCRRRLDRVRHLDDKRKRLLAYHKEFDFKLVLMLYGFALENFTKALLIARGKRATDGAGALDQDFKTHNLVHLLETAGIPVDPDEARVVQQMRIALERGRYPMRSSAGQPVSIVIHGRRDFDRTFSLFERVENEIRKLDEMYGYRCPLRTLGLRLFPLKVTKLSQGYTVGK